MRTGRLALSVLTSALALTACANGGSKETAQLRDEVSALRQQVAATSSSTTTTVPATTTDVPATTSTTEGRPTTTTTRPAGTPTTAVPTTATTVAPTTTTTRRAPQGTATWTLKINAFGGGPYDSPDGCGAARYHVENRSDTAIQTVTLSGVYIVEGYYSDGAAHSVPNGPGYQYRDGVSLPPQTVAGGIAPYGERDVDARWCPAQVSPGTFEWYTAKDRTSLTWQWASN